MIVKTLKKTRGCSTGFALNCLHLTKTVHTILRKAPCFLGQRVYITPRKPSAIELDACHPVTELLVPTLGDRDQALTQGIHHRTLMGEDR